MCVVCSNLADSDEKLIIQIRTDTTLFPSKVPLNMLRCLTTVFPTVDF